MKKPLVIYHADCTDGFGAAFAAWLKFGDTAIYRPFKYGEQTIPDSGGRDVYILDFSFPRDVMDIIFHEADHVVWLDHHKSAFEMWCPKHEYELFTQTEIVTRSKPVSCHITLDNNKSGALLAWEYFHPGTEVPKLIQHIDDRDRWQFKMEGSKELHAALQTYKPWSFEQWEDMFWVMDQNGDTYASDSACDYAIDAGEVLLRAQEIHVQDMAKQARGCMIVFNERAVPDVDQVDPITAYEYRTGLAVNANMHHSELGHELANKSGSFGLIWYVGQDGRVKCSLRSNGDYDVSVIAKAFGGGGHKNAAGFETDIDTIMRWTR